MPTKRIRREKSSDSENWPLKESWLQFFIIPGLWIIAASVPLIIFLKNDDPRLIRTLLIMSGGIAGALMTVLFIIYSPVVRSLKLRAKELQAFCEAIQKAASKIETQELLNISSEIIAQVTRVRGCTISILNHKTGELQIRAKTGLDTESEITTAVSYPGLLEGESLLVKDLQKRDFPEIDDEIESLLCVPLKIEEKTLGAVCIYGKKGQKLSSEMIPILSSLSNVIALALAHALVYDDLKNLVNTKTQFMFQTSHELRSPLNAIQSMTKLLRDDYMGQLNEKQHEILMRIETRTKVLSETVNDLMKMAKSRAQIATLQLTKVDLLPILQEIIVFFGPRATESQVTIETEFTANITLVKGTEELLRSIITNLISNAIKYTPPGGKVSIRLSETRTAVMLKIADTGIGIPKEDQPLLFQEFFRASNAKKITAVGTGLGLSIIKTNVEMCGGTIEFESEENKGTTFRIVLKK
jgi:signal transduction histidine kinase